MNQEIKEQVEDAIKRKLHLGMEAKSWSMHGMHWNYPVEIKEDRIIMRDSDCGEARPTIEITFKQWKERFNKYGLWKMVGMWDFVKDDDPAAHCIAWCHSNPDSAGRELYRLRKLVSEIRGD